MEGDIEPCGTDMERRSDVRLERIAHHEQLFGTDGKMAAQGEEICILLVGCDSHPVEQGSQAGAVELVTLVEQVALGEHRHAQRQVVGVNPSSQFLERLFHLRQRVGRQVEQAIAALNQIVDGSSADFGMTHADGRLDDREDVGLAAIAGEGQVLRLGSEQFVPAGIVVGPRTQQLSHLLRHLIEVSLTVP